MFGHAQGHSNRYFERIARDVMIEVTVFFGHPKGDFDKRYFERIYLQGMLYSCVDKNFKYIKAILFLIINHNRKQ